MREVDVLAEVLRAVRLRGTVYFQGEFGAPWGMDIPSGQVANFHAVVDGECWLNSDELNVGTALRTGDIVVFPHGTSHALLHGPDASAVPAGALLGDAVHGAPGEPHFGGAGKTTRIICGHFELDRESRHPLLTSLPPLIRVRENEVHDGNWMRQALALAAQETGSAQSGSHEVVDRLAEVLLIQMLRAHTAKLGEPVGFLAALSDPVLARALQSLHSDPTRQWTVDALSRTAGLSRTALSARFSEVIGLSPIRYLTEWRMARARELLTTTNLTLAQIADRSGYDSPFSFTKAFKRVYGTAPGALRAS